MKYLILATLLLTSCAKKSSDPSYLNEDSRSVPRGIGKFVDGNNTCYVFYQNAISCVRNDK